MRIYRIKTSYRFRYQVLVVLCNFIDGLVSVLTLGFFATSLEMEAHRLGVGDKFKQLKAHKAIG